MLRNLLRFFATGPDRPLLTDSKAIKKAYESKRIVVFIAITIGYGLFYICRQNLAVVNGPLIRNNIFSASEIGIIGSALLFTYAFGRFTNGVLADRANIRRFVSAGLLASAVVNLILGTTTLFWVFVILWGINGWFQSMGSAPSVVSLNQWFSQSERGTRYGLWSTSHCIGEGLTFALTAVAVSALGWRIGFFLPGLICVVASVVLFKTLADRPQTYGLPPVAQYRNDHPPQELDQDVSVGQRQIEVLKNPWVWVLGFSAASLYVARYAINSWGVLFLQMQKGHNLVNAGIINSAAPIAGLAGSISSGYLSDRFFNSKRHGPIVIYGLLQIVGLVAIYLVPPNRYWLDMVAMSVFGFATGGLLVFLGGLLAVDIVAKKATGAAMGMIGLFSYAGAGLQSIVSGYLIEGTKHQVAGHTHYSFGSAFAFWIAASVLSLCLAAATWKVEPVE